MQLPFPQGQLAGLEELLLLWDQSPCWGERGSGCIGLGHPHKTSSSLISMKGFGITSGQMGSGLWEERVGGAPLLLQTPPGNWQ